MKIVVGYPDYPGKAMKYFLWIGTELKASQASIGVALHAAFNIDSVDPKHFARNGQRPQKDQNLSRFKYLLMMDFDTHEIVDGITWDQPPDLEYSCWVKIPFHILEDIRNQDDAKVLERVVTLD